MTGNAHQKKVFNKALKNALARLALPVPVPADGKAANRLEERSRVGPKLRAWASKYAIPWHPLWKNVKRWSAAVPTLWKIGIAALGILLGAVPLLPRPSVTPLDNLDPHSPLTAPFIVSNDGYTTVHSAFFECQVDRLLDSRLNQMENNMLAAYPLGDIEPNGRTTAFCGDAIGGLGSAQGFSQAHVTLIIWFRPDFWPWHRTQKFPFEGLMGEDHIVRWFPVSK